MIQWLSTIILSKIDIEYLVESFNDLIYNISKVLHLFRTPWHTPKIYFQIATLFIYKPVSKIEYLSKKC